MKEKKNKPQTVVRISTMFPYHTEKRKRQAYKMETVGQILIGMDLGFWSS